MDRAIIDKAGEIIKANTGETIYYSLALLDTDDYPTVSTITASKTKGIEWITFCTGLGSRKIGRIEHCNRASVCFNGVDYSITLVGTIEVITETETKKEMWYGGLGNHFNGTGDPDYCVLRFTTEHYNLLVDWNEVIGTI